jgi:serine/threonine protein kinase
LKNLIGSDGAEFLVDCVRSVLARHGKTHWELRSDDTSCLVGPPGGRSRAQGWKVHVSATPLSAPLVLARAAEVLVRHDCSFKFAATVQHVQRLVSNTVDREAGGKFITAYCEGDDDELRALARELHLATEGLPGPGIHSDRRYQPGSLVHYRFGAFGGVPALGNDGSYEALLTTPDGSPALDRRNAWFSAPSWAPRDPFAQEPVTAPPARSPKSPPASVLLNGRFVVRGVIRHSYVGGVYRATDEHTGKPVVVKQARPHTGADLTGQDACDLRRHEADMLRLFQSSGFTPHLVDLFEQQGDLFLAQEEVRGVTLRQWAAVHADERDDDAWGPAPSDIARITRDLVDLMDQVHAEGFVFRDLKPDDLMVTDDGDLRLIDLEHLAVPGARTIRVDTPGYGAPEQANGPAPDSTVDLYSLGATLFCLVSGIDPLLQDDEPKTRTRQERMAAWLEHLSAGNAAARRFAPIIVALTHEEPARRPGLADVRDFLAGRPTPNPDIGPGAGSVGRQATGDGPGAPDLDLDLDRMIADAVGHLVATIDADNPERLWETDELTADRDPASVQHGAAGRLAALVRAYQSQPSPELRDVVTTVARWIRVRVDREPRLLPGLQFGRSGTAWALLQAGDVLGEEQWVRYAVDVARRVPLHSPNPDVCHGMAGAGLTQLRFWEVTGDKDFLSRARQAADAVAAAAESRDGLLLWPIPRGFASKLAGVVHYGFAHGVAGVGALLLAAGLATDDGPYLGLAASAAETLLSVAQLDREAAYWPSGERGGPGLTYWCSGSAGVGTFLVRMWQHSGDPRFRDYATQAAVAVRRSRWHSGPGQCCGLAGGAEFLLDLADATGEERFGDWAEELAVSIYAQHILRDGRMLPATGSTNGAGTTVISDWSNGLAGVLALLVRLEDRGPRLWLPESLTQPTTQMRSPLVGKR